MTLCGNIYNRCLSDLPPISDDSDVVYIVVIKSLSAVKRISLSDFVAARLRSNYQVDHSILQQIQISKTSKRQINDDRKYNYSVITLLNKPSRPQSCG